jgi:hypothetical protein
MVLPSDRRTEMRRTTELLRTSHLVLNATRAVVARESAVELLELDNLLLRVASLRDQYSTKV